MVPRPRTPLRVDRLRALNQPQPVEVRTDTQGLPTAVHLVSGTERWKPVEAIIETWRVDDEWWRKPISRLYVEAILQGGRRILLYRDLVTGEWRAQQP